MLKIGIITDLQYADADRARKRNYRASISKFLEAVGALEEERVDAIFHLGDSFDRDWENLTVVSELFRAVRLPFYNLLGNHDYLIPNEKKGEVNRLLLIPNNKGYYTFTMTDPESASPWRFIFLNGNEISLYASRDENERQNAQKEREKYPLADGSLPHDYNGAMSRAQLDWLEEELNRAEKSGEMVIVCNHFPLFCQGGPSSVTGSIPLAKIAPLYFAKLGVTLWNAEELLDVLNRHSDLIKGYWAGHLHEGAYGVLKGVPHITFRGIVEAEPNAWAVMEIHGGEVIANL
jgi:manganese-dependent ADP-ribose/CDP-alcohol diphosphatase